MPDEHLKDVLTHLRSEAGDELPDPSRGYEPFSRPSERPVYTLHLILGRDGYRSFQYVALDSCSSFKADSTGHVIRLRFCGSKIWDVTICGRNLLRLYQHLHEHRIAFVMAVERGRDFGEDHEPVVTAIKITEVKDADGEQP